MKQKEMKREVDFRLSKMLLNILCENQIITKEEMNGAMEHMAETLKPPYGLLSRRIDQYEDTEN